MDYLQRDSLKTGIPYGNYDFDYLSESFAWISSTDKTDSEKRIAILKKGLNALEHFYLAKYYWYTQIIQHPALAITEKIAKYIARELIKAGRLPSFEDWEDYIANSTREDFFNFDDNAFMKSVSKASNDSNLDKKLRLLCIALSRRIIPRILHEKKAFILSKKNEAEGNELPLFEKEFERLAHRINYSDTFNESFAASIYSAPQKPTDLFMYEKRAIITKPKEDEEKIEKNRDTPKLLLNNEKYIYHSENKPVLITSFTDSILHSLLDAELHIFRIYDLPKMLKDAEQFLK